MYYPQCVCGSRDIKTVWTKQSFPYGVDRPGQVQLVATVPVRRCQECGENFLDWIGTDLQEKAVNEHLASLETL